MKTIDRFTVEIRDYRGWRTARAVTGKEARFPTVDHADIAVMHYERNGYEARKSLCE